MKYFGNVRQKLFDGETWYPRLSVIPKTFRYPKFCETLKGCPRKVSALWHQNYLTGKRDPLLCINFFDTPIFLKLWRDAHEILRQCETKNFRRKNVIPPSHPYNFSKPQFFQKRRIPSRKSSVLWDNNFSIEICDIPLLCIEFFDTRNFLQHRRVPRQKFSALWGENFSAKIRDTLLHKV